MQFQLRVGNVGGGRVFTLHGFGITNKMAVREYRHRAVHHVGRADGALERAVRPKTAVITAGGLVCRRTVDV